MATIYELCPDLSKIQKMLENQNELRDDKKYIVVKGHVQSGKSKFMICASHYFIQKGLSVVILLRNMREDRLQLYNRFVQFNDRHRQYLTPHHLVKNLKNKKREKKQSIYLPLGNYSSIQSTISRLIGDENNENKTEYVLFIDEVDAVDSGGNAKKSEPLRQLKDHAKYIFGVSATTMDPFGKEHINVNDVILLTPPASYKGVINKSVNMIPVDKKCKYTGKVDADLFQTDVGLYSFLDDFKDASSQHNTSSGVNHPRICLINICDSIQPCFNAQEKIGEQFPNIVTIVYNSKGTVVRKGDQELYNNNDSISVCLQRLKDANITNPIVIFSGELAGRGISFVSSDFMWHLTDQRLLISGACSEADLIQKIRLCGVYHDEMPLTLYTTQAIIDDLVKASFRQEEYIHEMLENKDENDDKKTCKELIEEMPISKEKITRRKMTKDKTISFKLNVVKDDRRWPIGVYKKRSAPTEVYKMYNMSLHSSTSSTSSSSSSHIDNYEDEKEYVIKKEEKKCEKEKMTEKEMIDMLNKKLSSDKLTKESVFLSLIDVNMEYTKDQLCELLLTANYEQPKSMFNAITSETSKWGRQYFEKTSDHLYKIKDSLKVCWAQ